ncbi:PRD domain-containing protein [Corynebacterium sp. 3HC-13]|nr:PRD domain-containing protein [Corynebacterium poyangense]
MENKTGTVLRSMNNNAVLVTVDGQRMILMGRGIGFRRRLGDDIALSQAEEIFSTRLDASGRNVAAFLDEIPIEIFECCREALTRIGPAFNHPSQGILLALADHLSQAIARTHEGIVITYPTSWEVPHFYPQETHWGQLTLHVAREKLCPELPDEEAIALAMHFVNAQFTGDNLARTLKLTSLLKESVEAVKTGLGPDAPEDPLSVARFVTHLRYLFVRIMDDTQITSRVMTPPSSQNADGVDRAVANIQKLLEREQATKLTPAEVDYLRLHILRLSEPRMKPSV